MSFLKLYQVVPLLAAALIAAGCSGPSAAPAVPAPALTSAAGPALSASSASQKISRTPSGLSYAMLATRHFRVIYAGNEPWAASISRLLEAVYGEFYNSVRQAGLDAHPIRTPLVWVCFERHGDFEAYGRQADGMDVSSVDGYYSMRTNVVAVARMVPGPGQPPSGRMHTVLARAGMGAFRSPVEAWDKNIDIVRTTHEAAHQLAFNSGLQKRGVVYPLWVSEGLATNFESNAAGTFGFGHDNPERREGLLLARAYGRLASLDQLVVLTHLSSTLSARDERDYYAAFWGLFRFLLQEHPRELKNYLDVMARSSPGERSPKALRAQFVAAFGPIQALQGPWQHFLDSLR